MFISFYYYLFVPHIGYRGVTLRVHLIRGELHIQHNANWEFATTSLPFCDEPHWSHFPFVKAAPGMTFTCRSQYHIVAIWKPEEQVCKASHCDKKQQYRSHVVLTLSLLVRTTYIWMLFFKHILFVENHSLNVMPTERLQHLQQCWVTLVEMSESEKDKQNSNW